MSSPDLAASRAFDRSLKKLLAVNACAPSEKLDGLQFAASMRLGVSAEHTDATEEMLLELLKKEERLQPVTIRHLEERGITKFGWVKPNECCRPAERARHAVGGHRPRSPAWGLRGLGPRPARTPERRLKQLGSVPLPLQLASGRPR